MRVIIHIGYPKTGTTWLQEVFFQNITNYEYVTKLNIIRQLITCDALTFDARTIRELFDKEYKGKNVIISLEGLVGTTHSFGINGIYTKEIAYRLKQVFPEAEILMGIRNQITMIPSTYLQYLRGGGTYGLDYYLFHDKFTGIKAITLFSFNYFEYDKVIKLYVDLFGKDKVKVYLFEYFALNKKDFLNDLKKTYSFEFDITKIDFSVRLPRLRKRLIPIVRFMNIFTKEKMLSKYYLVNIPYFNQFRRIIIKILNKSLIFGEYADYEKVLGEKNSAYIKEYYKKSNHVLFKEYHLDVKKYSYPY